MSLEGFDTKIVEDTSASGWNVKACVKPVPDSDGNYRMSSP